MAPLLSEDYGEKPLGLKTFKKGFRKKFKIFRGKRELRILEERLTLNWGWRRGPHLGQNPKVTIGNLGWVKIGLKEFLTR